MIEILITIYGYSIALAPKLIGKKVSNSENKKSATKDIIPTSNEKQVNEEISLVTA